MDSYEPSFVTEPTVDLIAITENAEDLIELTGRVCYQSGERIERTVHAKPVDGQRPVEFKSDKHRDVLFQREDKGLTIFELSENDVFIHEGTNYKVERIDRESARALVRFLVKSGHLSVIEHASASFLITGGSRMFTHQFVRHRLASFSQESQRYCGYNIDEGARGAREMTWTLPPKIARHPDALAEYKKALGAAYESYKKLQDILRAAGEKQVNEDARAVLPNAATSQIAASANFREWRHIFELRCSPKAQWEIRAIALKMLEILQAKAPTVFGDFKIDRDELTAKPGHFE